MNNRDKRISEIEEIINNRNLSRRKFLNSMVKAIAYSSISALGASSIIACKKELIEEVNALKSSDCPEAAITCSKIFSCVAPGGGFICQNPFSCVQDNSCLPIICTSNQYSCSSSVTHSGSRSY